MLLLIALSCGRKAPPQPPVEPTEATPPTTEDSDMHGAAKGVSDPALAAVLLDHWEDTMRRSPVWATQLGDHRYDDQLGTNTPQAIAEGRAARDGFLARARALDPTALSEADRVHHELFVQTLEARARRDACQFERWSFSPRSNPLGTANYLVELHGPDDAANFLARVKQVPRVIDEDIANLRAGLQEGLVANAASTELTIAMFARELDKPVAELTLAGHAEAVPELVTMLDSEVVPALKRYHDFLRDEVLPASKKLRDPARPGLAGLPPEVGEACYGVLVQEYTTLPKTADELHETGLAELERIHAYMSDIGERTFGTRDKAAIFERLRTDPELYFETEEQVETKAAEALARAREAMPKWFGRLPQADCVVKRVPDYEAPYTTIAYYRQPSPGEPGTYYVNVHAPETRPRHEAEVLAFHESIPGHHLQIAIGQELPELPAFRRHIGMTAFVEGWGLYTEQLSDEMGLYSGDVDRLGMGSFEAWRASRLVVDTGIHAKGWSREQAEAFLLDNTPLAPNNIANEVDRYITTPGQALAYKTGQIEIWRLRRQAEADLGDRFDIAAFHDVVLGSGAVTLPVLERQVRAWVDGMR